MYSGSMSNQLTEAYENLIERYEPIVEDYARQVAKNEELERQISSVQKQYNEDLEDLNKSQYQVNELKKRNTELERSFDDYEESFKQKEKTIEKYAKEIGKLKKTLRTQIAESEECNALHTKTDELKKSEERLKNALAELKSECKREQGDLRKEKALLEGLLRDRNSEIAKIQAQGRTNRQSSLSNETQVLDYPNIIAELRRKNSDLRTANRDLADEAQTYEKELMDITAKANNLRQFYENVERVDDVEDFVTLYRTYFGKDAADKFIYYGELYADANDDPSSFNF